MKYEKAVAEVIEFGSGVYFLATSGGKTCNPFGMVTLDQDHLRCYSVSSSNRLYYTQGVFEITCNDIENRSPGTYRSEIDVDYIYSN